MRGSAQCLTHSRSSDGGRSHLAIGLSSEGEEPMRFQPESAGERIAERSICTGWPSSCKLLSKEVRPAARRCCSHGRARGRTSACRLAPGEACAVAACAMHSTCDLQLALQSAPLVIMQLQPPCRCDLASAVLTRHTRGPFDAAGRAQCATSHSDSPPSAVNSRAARLSD